MMIEFPQIINVMRPKHYIKNVFVVAPAFFSGSAIVETVFFDTFLAFIFFSTIASAIYVLNDLCDVTEDRRHPSKKYRPIASGKVSRKQGWGLFLTLSLLGFYCSYNLSFNFLIVILSYFILNVGYCVFLKKIAILDVVLIALGFVLRIFAGCAILGERPSEWIVLMTFLLALFLAISKRRDDVILYCMGTKTRQNISGYNIEFTNFAMIIMASVTLVSYIFYTITEASQHSNVSDYLYLTLVFVILGFFRYLQLKFVFNDNGSPVKLVFKDFFLQLVLLLWVFVFGFLIYGSRVM